jgi:diaminopimelate epimerase
MTDILLPIKYIKMQAQGNSYIYFDFLDTPVPRTDLKELAKAVSAKNFGIGSDGMVLLLPDPEADVLVRIWNADGSEAENCGSALRCVTALLSRRSKEKKNKFLLRIASGLVEGYIKHPASSPVVSIVLDNIGFYRKESERDSDQKNQVTFENLTGITVSAGNPHLVIFDGYQGNSFELQDTSFIHEWGKSLSLNSFFPQGTNVEFVKAVDSRLVSTRVWERGSGETSACGTGACAVLFAGMSLGLLDKEVEVRFPGGPVYVEYDEKDRKCLLSGEVSLISAGEFYYRSSSK